MDVNGEQNIETRSTENVSCDCPPNPQPGHPCYYNPNYYNTDDVDLPMDARLFCQEKYLMQGTCPSYPSCIETKTIERPNLQDIPGDVYANPGVPIENENLNKFICGDLCPNPQASADKYCRDIGYPMATNYEVDYEGETGFTAQWCAQDGALCPGGETYWWPLTNKPQMINVECSTDFTKGGADWGCDPANGMWAGCDICHGFGWTKADVNQDGYVNVVDIVSQVNMIQNQEISTSVPNYGIDWDCHFDGGFLGLEDDYDCHCWCAGGQEYTGNGHTVSNCQNNNDASCEQPCHNWCAGQGDISILHSNQLLHPCAIWAADVDDNQLINVTDLVNQLANINSPSNSCLGVDNDGNEIDEVRLWGKCLNVRSYEFRFRDNYDGGGGRANPLYCQTLSTSQCTEEPGCAVMDGTYVDPETGETTEFENQCKAYLPPDIIQQLRPDKHFRVYGEIYGQIPDINWREVFSERNINGGFFWFRNTQLEGTIPASLFFATENENGAPFEAKYFQIRNNPKLGGEIPENVGDIFLTSEYQNLSSFSLSDNNLSGPIPQSICNYLNHENLGNPDDWGYRNLYFKRNQFCPPYPDCLTTSMINEQDFSNCLDMEQYYGCTNEGAENYNPIAFFDDGTCEYYEGYFGCIDSNSENCTSEWCCTVEVENGYAWPGLWPNCAELVGIYGSGNYAVVQLEGSCEYPPGHFGCTDENSPNYSWEAVEDDGCGNASGTCCEERPPCECRVGRSDCGVGKICVDRNEGSYVSHDVHVGACEIADPEYFCCDPTSTCDYGNNCYQQYGWGGGSGTCGTCSGAYADGYCMDDPFHEDTSNFSCQDQGFTFTCGDGTCVNSLALCPADCPSGQFAACGGLGCYPAHTDEFTSTVGLHDLLNNGVCNNFAPNLACEKQFQYQGCDEEFGFTRPEDANRAGKCDEQGFLYFDNDNGACIPACPSSQIEGCDGLCYELFNPNIQIPAFDCAGVCEGPHEYDIYNECCDVNTIDECGVCSGLGSMQCLNGTMGCGLYDCMISLCQGDSGGPIVIKKPDSNCSWSDGTCGSSDYELIGVNSHGPGCGNGGDMASTNVYFYKDWINGMISSSPFLSARGSDGRDNSDKKPKIRKKTIPIDKTELKQILKDMPARRNFIEASSESEGSNFETRVVNGSDVSPACGSGNSSNNFGCKYPFMLGLLGNGIDCGNNFHGYFNSWGTVDAYYDQSDHWTCTDTETTQPLMHGQNSHLVGSHGCGAVLIDVTQFGYPEEQNGHWGLTAAHCYHVNPNSISNPFNYLPSTDGNHHYEDFETALDFVYEPGGIRQWRKFIYSNSGYETDFYLGVQGAGHRYSNLTALLNNDEIFEEDWRQESIIDYIAMHPGYRGTDGQNGWWGDDIALIHFRTKIELDPIRIISDENYIGFPFEGYGGTGNVAILMGWGATAYKDPLSGYNDPDDSQYYLNELSPAVLQESPYALGNNYGEFNPHYDAYVGGWGNFDNYTERYDYFLYGGPYFCKNRDGSNNICGGYATLSGNEAICSCDPVNCRNDYYGCCPDVEESC